MSRTVLYDYWRSSASYRLRIALNLLGIDYEAVQVNLLKKAHREPENLARNPQGLVPTIEIDGRTLTQSVSILEYLDETRDGAGFLPRDPVGRQRVRALSYVIAMEIHPVCNMSVAAYAMQLGGGDEQIRIDWMRKFIGDGLAAFEKMLDDPATGAFCHGDRPTMADICLVPQLYNAERWGADISACPKLMEIGERCRERQAFAAAHPERVGPPAD
ncbi:maleylacetoacetate isomerase [Rhizobiales bacterium]|uniref:maleylacetoacetate isomerase n=1 Tax=Hongsoonwoonella zoysiae TaxID=2821844 RepID=UPI00155F74C2|nr:maleylacetoacetate isomerase [Hongsoonwoonella zoysiae]NRG16733.1 maleylacetoacetate isomerase [Hongsoonwoonella zoysiae]